MSTTQFLNDSAQDIWERANPGRYLHLDSASLHQVRKQENAETLYHWTQNPGVQADSVTQSRAYHMAEELEYQYSEVLREEYAPNNALRLVPTDNSLPPGARTHTLKRVSHEGDVRVYRGRSDDKPTVGVQQDEQDFPVLTYVTSMRLDFFERQASSFANSNLRQELEIAARTAMIDFLNDQTWEGDDTNGLAGVWNYPYVPKTTSSVDFSASGTPSDQLDELHRLSRANANLTKQRFKPDTLVTSDRIVDDLATSYRTNQNDSDILSLFLEKDRYISNVEGIPEAEGAGPNGEDIMFFYDSGNRNSLVNVIAQGFQMLPMQEDGMDLVIPAYMQHGGVIMRKPLHNLVAYVSA